MIKHEFWSVENTGWSGGISWFPTGGSEAIPLRFNSSEKASIYAKKKKKAEDDEYCKWRVVHTTIERYDDKEVITNAWTTI